MFRKGPERTISSGQITERVDSVLGPGITWQGQLTGSGGVRIEGAFDGEILLRGLVVIGPQGRVSCEHLKAATVVVAGSVKGNITAQRVEIASSGRVWGDVVTTSFSTDEGAFLRGRITMEEEIDLGLGPLPEEKEAGEQAEGETEEQPEDE
jgi:cytoskeletal protein CcmA (bactofilin family)